RRPQADEQLQGEEANEDDPGHHEQGRILHGAAPPPTARSNAAETNEPRRRDLAQAHRLPLRHLEWGIPSPFPTTSSSAASRVRSSQAPPVPGATRTRSIEKRKPREPLGFTGQSLVRRRGLEPPRELPRQHLKLVRLPFRHLRRVDILESSRASLARGR